MIRKIDKVVSKLDEDREMEKYIDSKEIYRIDHLRRLYENSVNYFFEKVIKFRKGYDFCSTDIDEVILQTQIFGTLEQFKKLNIFLEVQDTQTFIDFMTSLRNEIREYFDIGEIKEDWSWWK